MFIVNVIKCAVLRRQHGLMTSAVSCVARVGQSSDSPRCRTAVTANAVYKSLSLNFRQFSCTCATNFRTANSFARYTDNDDSEASASGKEVITSKVFWQLIVVNCYMPKIDWVRLSFCWNYCLCFCIISGCSWLLQFIAWKCNWLYCCTVVIVVAAAVFYYFRSPAQIMYIVHRNTGCEKNVNG